MNVYLTDLENWISTSDYWNLILIKKQNVLETACNTSRIALRLVSNLVEMTAFDISPELLETGNKKNLTQIIKPTDLHGALRFKIEHLFN